MNLAKLAGVLFAPHWPGLPGFTLARPAERRQAPFGDLDDDHSSMLARLYGGGETLERAPSLDTEWWWCSIDAVTGGKKISIIIDVQIFILPGLGPQTNCTVALRNLTTKKTTRVRANGAVSLDWKCRFEGGGFVVGFVEAGVYDIDIESGAFAVKLKATLGDVAYFGDPDQPRGVVDNNPAGSFPLWINYRSRFGSVEGKVVDHDSGEEFELSSENSSVRFDQESVHWGLQDLHDLSVPAIAELVTTMPRWVWVDAAVELPDTAVGPRQLMITAFQVYNGHSGTLMKSYVGMCSSHGEPEIVDPDSIRLLNFDIEVDDDLQTRDSRSRSGLPVLVFDRLVRPSGQRERWKLLFRLTPEGRDVPNDPWVVNYPLGGPLGHRPLEVPAAVEAYIEGWPLEPPTGRAPTSVGERRAWSGLIEVFDLRKSLRFSEGA